MAEALLAAHKEGEQACRHPPGRRLRRCAHRWLIGGLLASALLCASASPAQPCIGDCDGSGDVSVDEIIRGVNIALGTQAVDACPSFDRNGDEAVTIDEIVAAVTTALDGCPEPTIDVNAILADDVAALDPATQARIAVADATSITFTGAPAAVAALHPGDIFIAQNTARKVVSIGTASGNTVIQTSEPEFSEVFRLLQMSGTVVLSDRDVVPPAAVAGTPVQRVAPANPLTVTLTDSLLHGTVTLEKPQVDFAFSFGAPSTDPQAPPNQYASLHFRTGEMVDLTFSSQSAFNVSRDIELWEFTRPLPVAFGTVDLHVVVTLHLAANGNAQLVVGLHQGLEYDAGVTATLNPLVLTPTNGTTHDFHVTAPQATGEANAVLGVVPEVDIQILEYSLAGIIDDFAIKANVTAIADPGNACFRFKVDDELSSTVFLLLPAVAVRGVLSWGTFFSGDISMQRYPLQLFKIGEPLYDSGEQCALPPVADAGPDLTVLPGNTVLLNGTASHDPSGAALKSYAWTQVAGSPVSLAQAATAMASFTAPAAPATLTFRLMVSNDKGATATDDVTVTVVTPVATATPAPTPTPTVAPPPPTHLRATAGDSEVTLTWDPVGGATSYNVYVASVSGVSPANYGTLPDGARHVGVGTPYVTTDVSNGTRYYFVVTTVSPSGESAPSLEVSATPHTPAAAKSSIASNGLARFTCVVLITGEVSCWGNYPGCQVIGGCLPTPVAGIDDAQMVAVGDNFTCALLGDGTVRCWGSNKHHVLGLPDLTATPTTPVPIGGIADAVAITAGEAHACAVLGSGELACWGANDRGQLGNGMMGNDALIPVTVSGLSGVTAASAGYQHTCALLGGGAVYCWGENVAGQLGQSTNVNSPQCSTPYEPCPPSPMPLAVTGVDSATVVSAGQTHSCAVLSNGSVVCWGSNSNLGKRLPTGNSVTPVEAEGISSATLVTAGYAHSCADGDGALYCWGFGNAGELGTGSNPASVVTPGMVQALSGASAVTTGYVHTCAVTGGTVECWGSNLTRMLGVGDPNNPFSSNVPLVTGITNAR